MWRGSQSAFCLSFLTKRACLPALRDVDFATSDLPSVAAARDAYEALRAERDRIAAVHAAYDAYEYHTIHGEKLPRFRPKSLTPAARLPEPSRLFTPVMQEARARRHHLQPLPPVEPPLPPPRRHRATAAVFSDAAHIVEEIALLKTRTSGAAGTTAAADPIE